MNILFYLENLCKEVKVSFWEFWFIEMQILSEV